MIPEKLELKDIDGRICLEIMLEIVRRYNGYADKDRVIEQLVKIVNGAKNIIIVLRGASLGDADTCRRLIDIEHEMDTALTAAKEKDVVPGPPNPPRGKMGCG